MDIKLGMRASDMLSPFKGVVFGVGRYMDGSFRVQLACYETNGDDAVKPWFDLGQLKLKDPLDTDPWDTVPIPEGEHPDVGDLVRSVMDEDIEGPVVARYDYLYGCSNVRVMLDLSDEGKPITFEDGLSSWELLETGHIEPVRHEGADDDDGEPESQDPTGGPREANDCGLSDPSFRQ